MPENQNIVKRVWEKLSQAMAGKNATYSLLFLLMLLYYFPLMQFYLTSQSMILIGSESIAYRFFYVYRMLSGERNPHLWLPQGFLTTSIHKLVFAIERLFVSLETRLDSSLEVFGYLTFVADSLVAFFLLFFVMRDTRLTNVQKVFILLGLFLPIFGFGVYGFYYILLPDYLRLDIVLSAAFIYYFYIISVRKDDEISMGMIAGIAFLSGIAVSNKISMIFLACAPAILIGIRFAKQPVLLMRILLIWLLTFVLGMLLPWLISHHPNYGIYNLGEYLKLWFNFVRNAPQEGGLLENIKIIIRYQPQYLRFIGLFSFFTIMLLTHTIQHYNVRSQQFRIVSGLIVIPLLQLFVVLRTRPAGTTNFEAFTALTSFTMMLIGFVVTKDKWLNRAKWGFITLCLVLIVTGLNFISTSSFVFSNKRIEDFKILRDIHSHAVSYQRPIIVVVPDNSFIVQMGMEELLLKGFSDFPTWDITAGRKLMDNLAPDLFYRSDYIEQKPEMPYPGDVVIMWYDKMEAPAEQATDLRKTYPELDKALSVDGTECFQWILENRDRIINLCTVP